MKNYTIIINKTILVLLITFFTCCSDNQYLLYESTNPFVHQKIVVKYAEPGSPFGAHTLFFYKSGNPGSGEKLLWKTFLYNDGAAVSKTNVTFIWMNHRTLKIVLHGSEQKDVVKYIVTK